MWYFGGSGSSSETNPTFNFNNAGTYTVLLVAQPGVSCADSVRQIITVNYYPVHADFTYENPIYSNDVNFFNLSSNGYSYEWSFGDGYGSTLYEPTHSYEQMGLYTVCLKTTNFQGCSDVICKNINVDSDWTLYVPDAFTPNDDNINDIFHAYGTNIKNFHMDIFDRWGEKIFTSDDIHDGWDGTYKGKLVKDDVYVWKINFTDCHSKAHDKAGHVTFIR
jgi:gliding motility-associated-like protein